MPIGLSPQATLRLHLKVDQATPEPQRPAFVCRFVTANERLKLTELFRRFDNETAPEARTALLCEAARLALTGVENIPNCTLDNLADHLTFDELDELTTAIMVETRLAERDRLKSASAQPSSTAGSAPPAASAATA